MKAMEAIKQAREQELAALRDKLAMQKQAKELAEAELQRLIEEEVVKRRPELEAEVSKRLAAERTKMLAEVDSIVQQEREEQLAKLRSVDLAAEQRAQEVAAAAAAEKQAQEAAIELQRRTEESELKAKQAGDQMAKIAKRQAAEKSAREDQAKVRNLGGGARPKLKFGFGSSSLL